MKKNEAELETKEARYRALAETVPVGIWHLHENGNTVYVNPFLLALLGMTEGEFAATDPKGMLACGLDKGIGDMIGTASRFETDLMARGRVVAKAMVVSSGMAGQCRSCGPVGDGYICGCHQNQRFANGERSGHPA